MRTYRAPQVGDLLAVRSSDPHIEETQVRISTVADTGDVLLLAGTWGGRALEVVVRRVGNPNPPPETE